MVWGYHEDDRPWHDDINDLVDDKYDIILGFNEPNHADQSDISPEEAAEAWIELQNLYPDKVPIYFSLIICSLILSCRFLSVLLLLVVTQTGLIHSLRYFSVYIQLFELNL